MHCLNALFSEQGSISHDMTHHIKSVIDFHVTGKPNARASLEDFARTAVELLKDQNQLPTSYGLHLLDLRGKDFDPLWLQEELVRCFKKLSGCRHALLLVSGLKSSLTVRGKRFTHKRREQQEATIDYIDELAGRYSSPSMQLTLLYV